MSPHALPSGGAAPADETSDRAGEPLPHAVDSRGRVFELDDSGVRVTTRRGVVRLRLDDPSDTHFVRFPHVDLSDGRPLRRAAFDVWAANVNARLAVAAIWETTYRPRRPYHTTFAVLGGAIVGGSALWSVLAWASSNPQVRKEPGLAGGIVLLAGIALLLWIAGVALTSAARYWLSRTGSYVRIDGHGVTLGKGARPRPASDIASAVHFPLLRATRVALRGGGAVWVPAERGPLARLDLVLAALPGGPKPAL